jgi:hypothetical protein
MRAGITVTVTPEAIVRDSNRPQKHVAREKVILATDDGGGTSEIMRREHRPLFSSRTFDTKYVENSIVIQRDR